MNLEYKNLLPTGFAANSRVWVYQSNRLFTINEALQVEKILEDFVKNWNSHGAPVKGFATMFFGQFIVLMADETNVHVGGCSTDSSVHVIKQIEQAYHVNLFDRQLLAFIVKDKIQLLPMPHIDHAVKNEFITGDTLYFNNTVHTKNDLENNWIIPVKESWLAKRTMSFE